MRDQYLYLSSESGIGTHSDFIVELAKYHHFGGKYEIAVVQHTYEKSQEDLLMLTDLVELSTFHKREMPIIKLLPLRKSYGGTMLANACYHPMRQNTNELCSFRVYIRTLSGEKVLFRKPFSCVLHIREAQHG